MFQCSRMNLTAAFPIQLVRGQSIEMIVNNDTSDQALLCGKYVLPMREAKKVLVGATHEFKELPLSEEDVLAQLKDRSYLFASSLWDHGRVERITSGVRVQSQRGAYGRLPIIGKYENLLHPNTWIFTGLSSRGMLYHGMYGEYLSRMILGQCQWSRNDTLDIEVDWWKN
jgi:glycine/D-amino acid oxidase-like deaminating enzyme